MHSELDAYDRRILELLQEDASLSSAQIAERVGLSQSPCWRRIQRLKDEGVIRGQVTLLDRKKIGLNMSFTDLKQDYGLIVENGVLNHGKPLAQADARVTLSKATLDAVQLKEVTLEQAIARGDIRVEGRREALAEFLGLLDTFPFWFNIVTP